jgi:isocitrate/isopropylmalate dehydrogenase
MAACLLLEHIGDGARAKRIVDAFEAVIREKTRATRDLGGTSGTSQFADAIIARLG